MPQPTSPRPRRTCQRVDLQDGAPVPCSAPGIGLAPAPGDRQPVLLCARHLAAHVDDMAG